MGNTRAYMFSATTRFRHLSQQIYFICTDKQNLVFTIVKNNIFR
jgi:hypothetical protein